MEKTKLDREVLGSCLRAGRGGGGGEGRSEDVWVGMRREMFGQVSGELGFFVFEMLDGTVDLLRQL